ncbi:MAG TPA: FAD:protein FMN transferase [Planctomycetota bacterium]
MNRRRFLALSAGAGGLAALAGLRPRGLQKVERTSWALGTQVSLTAFHEDEATARRAADASFEALDRIEDVLSLYRPGSQIRRLNADGVLERPHADLVAVLRAALDLSRRTNGAFDPTVQPLWKAANVDDALRFVDWRQVEVDDRRVRLGPGQAITLNGIAQGFAADRVRDVLRAHGIRHALANTGEFAGFGRPWRVGIQHPRRPDAYVALAALEDRFLATSGDYETAFTPDFKEHHIYDPATGRSPQTLASATIVAPTGMEADALGTAIIVLGPDQGLALAASRKGVDVLLVLKDGTILRTPSFPVIA